MSEFPENLSYRGIGAFIAVGLILLVTGGIPFGHILFPRSSGWIAGHPLYMRISGLGFLITAGFVAIMAHYLVILVSSLVTFGFLIYGIYIEQKRARD